MSQENSSSWKYLTTDSSSVYTQLLYRLLLKSRAYANDDSMLRDVHTDVKEHCF